jgi:cyclase
VRGRTPSRHFRVERLAAGVHAAIATDGGFGLCNAGIIDLGGQTVVFDSMLTPMAGADLARAAERATGRRPDWVVNSHWHGDHIWGNSAFVPSHIVSTRRARDVIRKKSRSQWAECRRSFAKELVGLDAADSPMPPADRDWVRGWFQGVLATPSSHRIVPPNLTFEESLVLEGRRRSLHLLSYGGGHSPSDVFAYLPEEGILFSGDLVMVGLHPSVGGGWPDTWARMLGRMARLRVHRVVPGHGPVGPGAVLAAERRYLVDLQRTVARAIDRGTTVQEACALPVPKPYRAWHSSFFYPDNLRRAYRLATARRRSDS